MQQTMCSLPLRPLAVVMYLDVIFTIWSSTKNGKKLLLVQQLFKVVYADAGDE